MYKIRDFLRHFCENARIQVENFYEHERMRILNFIPVVLGTGICCFFNLDNPPSLIWSVSFFLILLALSGRFKLLRILLIFVFGFMLAQLRTIYVDTPMLEKTIEEPQSFFATVDSCYRTESGMNFVVKDSSLKPELNKIFLSWRGKKAQDASGDFMPGDRVSFFAKLSPLNDQPFPQAYNFKRQQYFNRISARGFVMSPPKKVEYLYQEITLALLIDKFRHKINQKIDETLDSDDAAIAKALITGTKSSISKDLRENFVRSGTAHILAISGLHIGIVGLFIFVLIRLLLCCVTRISMFYDVKKIAAIVSLAAAIVFYFISGCSVSAMRALIMHALVILAIILDREAVTMRSIAIAATIIMILSPEAIMFPSFQLSFSAVIAIVAFYERFWNFSSRFKMLINIVATTVVATLSTSIFSVFVFNQLTLNSVFANIFMIPLMSFFVMPMVIVCLLCMLINVTFPLKILALGISSMIKLAKFSSTFVGSLFVMHSPSPIVMTILIFSALIFTLIHHRIRWAGFIGLLAGILLYFFQDIPRIIISPNAKAYGARVGDDLTCFNHCGYFRATLSAWTKSVGCSRRENFKSKACRKFVERLDDDSVKISADGQDFILTSNPKFPDNFEKLQENSEKEMCKNPQKQPTIIFLDKTSKEFRQIY
ncbi:MAG: ComEC/Rec2 family competence protein [Alphaproteobacteria bacterium]|nr:ComEC/Rec2 family competence protein [Alphaproteobacteria bacterium]